MASSPERPSDSKQNSPANQRSSSSSDLQNPFIAFRHFADSHISSLLQSATGLPSLIAHADMSKPWSSIDEFMAKRREAAVRARQELIDELVRQTDRFLVKTETDSRMRGQELDTGKSSALVDERIADRCSRTHTSERRTIPLVDETLGWDGRLRGDITGSRSDEENGGSNERFPVSTPAGEINLKRVVDRWGEGQGFWIPRDDARLGNLTNRAQDPFNRPEEAVSWLLTDDYSPLYLENALAYKLHPSWYKSDCDASFFRADYHSGDRYPRFASESVVRHDPRLAARLDWRAAFHDLLDVHHTGALRTTTQEIIQPPRCVGFLGPWIEHLIGSGSLGPQWCTASTPECPSQPFRFRYGNSSEAWAVMPWSVHCFITSGSHSIWLPGFGQYEPKNDALPLIRSLTNDVGTTTSTTTRSEEDQRRVGRFAESKAPSRLPSSFEQSWMGDSDDEGFAYDSAWVKANCLENETAEALGKAVEGFEAKFDTADGCYQALAKLLRKVSSTESQTTEDAQDWESSAAYGVPLEESENDDSDSCFLTPPDTRSQTVFSSSSSNSYTSESCSTKSPDSILSTLTTVESRTLPDGSVETKRVLRKRFADGREESSESKEVRPTQIGYNSAVQKSVWEEPKAMCGVTAGVDHGPSPEEQGKRRSGWFWR